MNNIIIDMVTGTVLNYDPQVVVVDTDTLDDYEQKLLDEWYECGNDSIIVELGALKGTPITKTPPPSKRKWWAKVKTMATTTYNNPVCDNCETSLETAEELTKTKWTGNLCENCMEERVWK